MQRITATAELPAAVADLRRAGRTVALVPTSGALHAGHGALIAAARERGDAVVVSVFVNPLAFGPSEPVARYPRTPEFDAEFCRAAGADLVFIPATEDLLPRGFSTAVVEDAVSRPLCGISRPHHFRGVATVTLKLLQLVRPERLVLGQRDAQQVAVLRKLNHDLCLGVELVVVPTVRDADGLPWTARSKDLTPGQRQEAAAVSAALRRAREMVAQGVRIPDRIIAEVTHLLGQKRRLRVIYVSLVDPHSLEALREVVPGRSLLALAVWIDEFRLIDNVEL
ncbi:MAG: pantoate--beta-alanine ligase [Verrucomicrobiota bacterium]